jgi:hypothetical protein
MWNAYAAAMEGTSGFRNSPPELLLWHGERCFQEPPAADGGIATLILDGNGMQFEDGIEGQETKRALDHLASRMTLP